MVMEIKRPYYPLFAKQWKKTEIMTGWSFLALECCDNFYICCYLEWLNREHSNGFAILEFDKTVASKENSLWSDSEKIPSERNSMVWITGNVTSKNSWKYSRRNDKSWKKMGLWAERWSFSLISVSIEKDASCHLCLFFCFFVCLFVFVFVFFPDQICVSR